MRAKLLAIRERNRERMSIPLTLNDFTVTDAGSIAAEFVLEAPTVSLCCLDDENGHAIFAELPSDLELSNEPFFHQAQFEHARRLISLDYGSFHQLAGQMALRPTRLAIIHNIGRCGSTLTHHIFNRVPQVTSLSEPDALSQIHSLRAGRNVRDPEFVKLLRSSVRFLFKPSNYPDTQVGIVKLRNQCIDILNLFWVAFPEAYHLFLYRSAAGWVASLYSRQLRSGTPPAIPLEDALAWWENYYHHPIDLTSLGLAQLPATISSLQQLTISWLWMMDQYLRFRALGAIMPALRYEELNSNRDDVLSALFMQMGLPVAGISDALTVFDKDSQAGTRLARTDSDKGVAFRYSDAEMAELNSILQRHPVIQSSDYVVPETILAV